jgi:hypothetical protein
MKQRYLSMLPLNFNAILIRCLGWTPVIVGRYYVNNYNNEELKVLFIVFSIFNNLNVLILARNANRKPQYLEHAFFNHTKLFIFYLSAFLFLFNFTLVFAPWLPPTFYRERMDIRRQL